MAIRPPEGIPAAEFPQCEVGIIVKQKAAYGSFYTHVGEPAVLVGDRILYLVTQTQDFAKTLRERDTRLRELLPGEEVVITPAK